MDVAPHALERLSRLRLDFWGTTVDVLLQNSADLAHFDYYFQDHRRTGTSGRADFEIAFTAESKAFTDGSADALRSIFLRTPEFDWSCYEKYRGAARKPSPLPPFPFPPLSSTVRTVHASAASAPWAPDQAVLLHGPSLAGKSVLLLELLRTGWGFVSDDTVPIERERRLLSYRRPIGVRERTLGVHPWLRPFLAAAPSFRTPTGTTWAVHPAALPVRRAPQRTEWSWTVVLSPAAEFELHRIGEHSWRLAFDPARHARQAVAELSTTLNASTGT
ncbi:hypothetical protein ACWD4P_20820 [Kitasatospora sp. NPDC002543]